ncbi:hypothetical protein MKY96_32880 [Paenibacillus sp. FSL R7-0302]|uniref:hypothetical protein n=1 Tax=Paenibacillus sp. FSL R7-0302 TaxID=2921681 RepID=UPI0030FB3A46
MTTQLYLMKYSDNWADEMDVQGHCIINQNDMEYFIDSAEMVDYSDFYVGTNEEITYKGKQSVLKAVKFIEITKEESEVLERLGLDDCGFASTFYEFVTLHAGEDGEGDCPW